MQPTNEQRKMQMQMQMQMQMKGHLLLEKSPRRDQKLALDLKLTIQPTRMAI
jgi:hypothetical protein